MNVVDVYQRWGITGRGSVVSILDDGIEKDHPDLVANYVRHILDFADLSILSMSDSQ